MPTTPIIATLGYVKSSDGTSVLMIHRNARPDDPALGKYNGLGGKVERDEDVAACMIRELREEAGIEAESMILRGTILWPGFGKSGEDWMGFVFVVDGWSGEPLQSNPEGALSWVTIADVLAGAVPLWPGDRHFLPLVFDEDARPFHGVMPYENGQAVGWSFTRV
jgi:8-oxo-dGTP diphosphatase